MKHPLILRLVFFLLSLLLLCSTGCSQPLPETEETADAPISSADTAEILLPDPVGATASNAAPAPSLNGWSLKDFTIVYSKNEPDYTARAALWLQEEIKARTGLSLPLIVAENHPQPSAHEIVVGETDREISRALNAGEVGLSVSYMARRGHIAMEGNAFAIAAAVYRFAEDYITDSPAATAVSHEITLCDPITATPKNFVLLIGDGMGKVHTRLYEAFQGKHRLDYTDGETIFYGHLFPYQGQAITASLSGTTDSAAAATALATGIKTKNRRIGQDENGTALRSITELAASLGMKTAVMSTEVQTGATPAGFSAHTDDRNNTEEILASQEALQKNLGTILLGGYNYYTANELKSMEKDLSRVLEELFSCEKGSFLMFEEAYIDKHSHNNELEQAFRALARFNQIIGLVMEQAFYHPDTAVILTADHETGELVYRGTGSFQFTSDGHSNLKVPVLAYGSGLEALHGKTIENVQIPKTIAALMNASLATETDGTWPPLC